MSRGENIFKSKDGRWEARYIKGYELSGKIKYGFCYLPPACPHPETDRWKRQRKSLRPGTSGIRRKTGWIAEARNNGQNYRFSKLLSYPHKDWFKWGISDYFSGRWHLRSTLMKQVGNRHLTDLWAVFVQGHGRIVAPNFCVAHRYANSRLSTLNRTKSILSIYHQQRQLHNQRGMCLNDTYPFCQQPLSGNCHSICFFNLFYGQLPQG